MQFPISFKNTEENRDWLDTLIGKFHAYPLAVEVRHASWANEGTLRYFAEKGVAFCNIDQPLLGRSLRPTEHVTSQIGYVRLHGRNYDQWFEAEQPHDRYNYLYATGELAGWKEKIEHIAEKAGTTYVLANNHYEAKGAANALQIRNMLTGLRQQAPETLLRRYPELREVADPLRDDAPGLSFPA